MRKRTTNGNMVKNSNSNNDNNNNNNNRNSSKNNSNTSNKRRVPVGNFLKLKKNSFLLYVELQQMSNWNQIDNHRYVPLNQLVKKQIAKKLGISLNTLKTKMVGLEECGMIIYVNREDKQEGYIKLPNESDYYVLVDLDIDFVKALLELNDELTLRVFLFHKSYSNYVSNSKNTDNSNLDNDRNRNKNRKNKDGSYTVTLDYIAECVGWCKNHSKKITSVHNLLASSTFNILQIEKEYVYDASKGTTVQYNKYRWLK